MTSPTKQGAPRYTTPARPFKKPTTDETSIPRHRRESYPDALGIAFGDLLAGREARYYLPKLRSTGKWCVLAVCGGRKTWMPVPSRGAGVELILSMGGAF